MAEQRETEREQQANECHGRDYSAPKSLSASRDRDDFRDRLQPLDRGVMHLAAERRAAVRDHGAVELAHMRVAHRRGDAAIGHDAGEIEVLDAAFLQHPFEPRGVERRIGDLLHVDVGGRERRRPAAGPSFPARNRPSCRNGRSAFRCGEMIGSPPRPGTSVNSVATMSTPLSRAARTSGARRAGSAAMAGSDCPARP